MLMVCASSGVQAEVTSALLFPSHAQLVWEQEVNLNAGSGEITLKRLPVSMRDNTLMAEIRGLSGITTQRVQIQRVEEAEVVAGTTRDLRNQLQKLEQTIGAREDRIQAWNQQLRLMAGASAAEITAPELAELATTVQEMTEQGLARIRDIRQSMAEEIAERDRIKRELAGTRQDARATKNVTIAYQSPRSGTAKVRLEYQTEDASWQSQYNARLKTGVEGVNGTLVLEHLALIRQTTGFDWSGVQLSLSTANARSGTDIPPIYPWVVAPGADANDRSKSTSGLSRDSLQAEMASAPREVRVRDDGAFTQSYQVAAPVSLASSNADQFVTIANHEIPVGIETRLFPAMNPAGFVYATGGFESEASLPAGPVSLYRDGQSVGFSHMDSLSTGGELIMGFGVNDRLVAKIVNEQDQKGEQGVFKGEKYVRRINRYEITNNHPEAVAIRVFDRIPVSRQDDLTVTELEITQPVTRNTMDMDGVLAWQRTLDSGETVSLTSGFELRVPEDSQLPPEF